MHILHLYVRYDYVQRCEDTVSVELRYINFIYYYYYYYKLGQVKGDLSGRERANIYTPPDTQYTCVVQHVIRVWIVPGT